MSDNTKKMYLDSNTLEQVSRESWIFLYSPVVVDVTQLRTTSALSCLQEGNTGE